MPVRSETMSATEPLLARLKADHGAKALRYCGVSVVNVLTGLSTLAFFHGVLHWSGVASNLMAWSVSTAPAYLLSRAWVWQQSGSHRLSGEVVPFWVMALVGLLLSTFVVNLVDQRTDRTTFILAALVGTYGVVWVVKYVILDKVMWQRPTVVDPVEIG